MNRTPNANPSLSILMTEFICTDDNHCQNEGACGRTRDGMCDCKPNYDFKPDCSGKLDDEKYLYDCIINHQNNNIYLFQNRMDMHRRYLMFESWNLWNYYTWSM